MEGANKFLQAKYIEEFNSKFKLRRQVLSRDWQDWRARANHRPRQRPSSHGIARAFACSPVPRDVRDLIRQMASCDGSPHHPYSILSRIWRTLTASPIAFATTGGQARISHE
jgi:hypothetical protein